MSRTYLSVITALSLSAILFVAYYVPYYEEITKYDVVSSGPSDKGFQLTVSEPQKLRFVFDASSRRVWLTNLETGAAEKGRLLSGSIRVILGDVPEGGREWAEIKYSRFLAGDYVGPIEVHKISSVKGSLVFP